MSRGLYGFPYILVRVLGTVEPIRAIRLAKMGQFYSQNGLDTGPVMQVAKKTAAWCGPWLLVSLSRHCLQSSDSVSDLFHLGFPNYSYPGTIESKVGRVLWPTLY